MIFVASLQHRTQDKMDGYLPLFTREDLDKIIGDVETANRVIIRRDFAEQNFTPSSLVSFIKNSKIVNSNVTIELDEETEFYTPNEYYAKLAKVDNIEDLISIAVSNEKQFMSCFKELLGEHTELNTALVKAGSSISKQQEVNDRQAREIHELEHQLEIERINKQFLADRLNVLVSRINFQYNIGVDKSRLFFTDHNSFDKILYIKEITRVQYVDTLVYYLREILKVIYSMPVRVLAIESYYAMDKVHLYPDFVPHFKLKERDVVNGNILMLGVQPKLLGNILKNPSSISVLIVLDRAGYQVPHVLGDNVEYFYTASDMKDVGEKIPAARVISYTNDSLNIPVIDRFDELEPSAKLAKYSSLPIVQKLIDVLRS